MSETFSRHERPRGNYRIRIKGGEVGVGDGVFRKGVLFVVTEITRNRVGIKHPNGLCVFIVDPDVLEKEQ